MISGRTDRKAIINVVVYRARNTRRDSRSKRAAQDHVRSARDRAGALVFRIDFPGTDNQSTRTPGLVHFILVRLRLANVDGNVTGVF